MNEAVRYLQVVPERATLPSLEGLPPFRAIVLVRETVSNDWRNRVSDWLVSSGCLYMLAWGIDCSVWDDAVDWSNLAAFDFKPIPPDRFVMTTWHEDESMEEVFWFAKHSAEHPTVSLGSNLILDIASTGQETETVATWMNA
jgi:hypothetical protein